MEIKNEFFIDKTKKVHFYSKKEPYQTLYECFGEPYKEYRKKWLETSQGELELSYPLHLDFVLNESCNIKCFSCPFSVAPNERPYPPTNKEIIPLDVFEKIIIEGVENGLCSIEFGAASEPLLINNLEEYVSIAKQHGIIDIILFTNAHLLTYSKAKKLINAGITWINISIGATTKETYESMRELANFDLVIKNVNDFIKAKKELNSPTPIVRVSFVNTKQNTHELEDFINYWEEKVDTISIQSVGNPFKNTPKSKEFIEKFFLEKQPEDQKPLKVCYQPYQRLVVRNNGDICPCCRFHGFNLVFGNIYKGDTIKEVFNSQKMKNFRANLNTENRTGVCQSCMDEGQE